MSSFVMKINGIKHKVTVNSDGTNTYDPPLVNEASEKERMQKNLEEMVETGSFPGCSTETRFWSNRPSMAEQFKGDEGWLKHITDGLKKRGVNPRANGFYFHSLVRPGYSDGDPEAYVDSTEGLSKIKKIIEKRGLSAEGPGLKVKADAPDKDYFADAKPLAENIVQRMSAEYKTQDEHKHKSARELREMVISKHGAQS